MILNDLCPIYRLIYHCYCLESSTSPTTGGPLGVLTINECGTWGKVTNDAKKQTDYSLIINHNVNLYHTWSECRYKVGVPNEVVSSHVF